MCNVDDMASQGPNSPPPASPGLGYAPPPGARGRAAWRSVRLVLGLCLALAGWRWGPTLVRHTQFLRFQQQCLAYLAPAEQVVFLESGDANARIQPAPRCWVELNKTAGTTATQGAMLFLHELKTSRGERRLVAVEYTGGGLLGMTPIVVKPASWRTGPALCTDLALELTVEGSNLIGMGGMPARRFYAGRVDGADPAHFIIPFDDGQPVGMSGQIDGRLLAGGNALAVTVHEHARAANEPVMKCMVHITEGRATVASTTMSISASGGGNGPRAQGTSMMSLFHAAGQGVSVHSTQLQPATRPVVD